MFLKRVINPHKARERKRHRDTERPGTKANETEMERKQKCKRLEANR